MIRTIVLQQKEFISNNR